MLRDRHSREGAPAVHARTDFLPAPGLRDANRSSTTKPPLLELRPDVSAGRFGPGRRVQVGKALVGDLDETRANPGAPPTSPDRRQLLADRGHCGTAELVVERWAEEQRRVAPRPPIAGGRTSRGRSRSGAATWECPARRTLWVVEGAITARQTWFPECRPQIGAEGNEASKPRSHHHLAAVPGHRQHPPGRESPPARGDRTGGTIELFGYDLVQMIVKIIPATRPAMTFHANVAGSIAERLHWLISPETARKADWAFGHPLRGQGPPPRFSPTRDRDLTRDAHQGPAALAIFPV